MKISQKLFLILLTIVVALVLLCSLTILALLEKQTELEKLEMSDESVRQMLLSYEYVTDDIERYAYDRAKSEELAGYLNSAGSAGTAGSVRVKLDAIILNNPYLSDGMIVDAEGRLFHSGLNKYRKRLTQLYENAFFDSNRDVVWLRDDEGELYLRRNIYQVYPYRVVGFSVFCVNQEHLRAMVGMNNFSAGQSCIIDGFGNIILMTSNSDVNNALFHCLLDKIRAGEVLPRALKYSGEDYRIIAVNRKAGAWSALYAVTRREYLASFLALRRFVWLVGALLAIGSAYAAYWISFAFTANLRKLKECVNQLDRNIAAQRIPDIGRDEVGELADDFNLLLERLDQLYSNILKESAEKQKSEYELLEFQYRSLQSQVSPHFLCNILSSISLMAISGEAQQVERLAIDASQYLRSNLKSNDKKYSTLQEEIRLVREYVHLVESISAVSIRLRVHCDPAAKKAVIPNMLLQPLIENSLKHGIPTQTNRTFLIDLSIELREDGSLSITIADNGVGYNKRVIEELRLLQEDQAYVPKHVGFGTAGVIRRLALQYGKAFRFEAGNGEKRDAITRITLPHKLMGE